MGVSGAAGHVVEYAGRAIQSLTMEGRMTVCNMTIEGGGRAGMIAPDETTFEWGIGRSAAPPAVPDEWRGLEAAGRPSFPPGGMGGCTTPRRQGGLGPKPGHGVPGPRNRPPPGVRARAR